MTTDELTDDVEIKDTDKSILKLLNLKYEASFAPVDWREVEDWKNKIFTYSGQLASPKNPPPLYDMAVCTGRLPRFSGNCQVEWVVLAHEINVANILRRMGNYKAIPYALLHDGSEALFGDIPTPFKTKDMLKLEEETLTNIYLTHELDPHDKEMHELVKYADGVALVLEAEKTLLPKVAEYFTEKYGEYFHISPAVRHISTPVLERLIWLCNNRMQAFRPGGNVLNAYVQAVERMTLGREDPKTVFDEMLETMQIP